MSKLGRIAALSGILAASELRSEQEKEFVIRRNELLPPLADTTNSFFTQQSDTSRGKMLHPKEYARRKKRRQMQKWSRKQNRKH